MVAEFVLLDGELQPVSPVANYPMVLSRTSDKLVAAMYQDMVVAPGPQVSSQTDVVNAKHGSSVVLRFEQSFGPAMVRIRDCQGSQINEQTQVLGGPGRRRGQFRRPGCWRNDVSR